MAKKKNEEYADDSGDEDCGEEPNFEDPDGFVDDVTDDGKLRIYQVFVMCKR